MKGGDAYKTVPKESEGILGGEKEGVRIMRHKQGFTGNVPKLRPGLKEKFFSQGLRMNSQEIHRVFWVK
jgi:hypothetical protein